MSPGEPDAVTNRDLSVFARWLLSPSTNVHLKYDEKDLRPNEHGGKTQFYTIQIWGVEAIPVGVLEFFVTTIKSHGSVTRAYYVDLDDDSAYYNLQIPVGKEG